MPTPPPSSTRRLDVEAVLGAAGFTPFHRKAVAITGIANLADGAKVKVSDDGKNPGAQTALTP